MTIEDRVKNILSELSGVKDIKNTDSLQYKLAMDSLSMVTMILEIEEEFNIELDESDMNPFNLDLVENVINMVRGYCDG